MAKRSELKVGDILRTDGGFTCMFEGELKEVMQDKHGFYINCRCGHHYIDGQIDYGDHDTLVGLENVNV